MATPLVFTGARAIININNRLTVFATDVSYQVETEFRTINEIDSSVPNELSPGKINVNVTVSSLRVALNSVSVDRIQAKINNNMSQPYSSIEIKDRGTNQTILFVPQAQLVRRAGSVRARGLGTESWTFIGIGYWDERTPKAPELTTGGAASAISRFLR
jgi:hypothetical protein